MKHKIIEQAADAARGELSADQRKAREAIVAGRDLTVIRGFAGQGKSKLLEQARADLKQGGEPA